jgi:hypothetical protein
MSPNPVLLDPAPRGEVFGLVTRGIGGPPRDVMVRFTPVSSPADFVEVQSALATSPAPDAGLQNYTTSSLPMPTNLPEGLYNVSVNDLRFQPFGPVPVNVIGNMSVRRDISLTPLPGRLSGTVRDAVTMQPIANATVQILNGAIIVAGLTTNGAGQYQTLSTLPPAQYTVRGSHPNYITGTVGVFVEGDTVAPDLLLQPVPPSHLTGTVRSKVDNAPIADVTVEVLDSQNNVVATAMTAANGSYDAFPVPPGTYTVRATKAGWKVASQSATVLPGIDRNNVNFLLDPDHLFGAGLLLISLPDDFPGVDLAALFDQDPMTFRSAYWITEQNRYAIYPEAPAAEIRLGKGMFVRLFSPTPFTKSGTPAPTAPFYINLKTGWNMIGHVRRQRIEWLRTRVLTATGNLSLQEAMNLGIVQNGLFAYQDQYFRTDFLDPFRGYWVRVFQDCTLCIPVSNTNFGQADGRLRLAAVPAPSAYEAGMQIWAAGLGPHPLARGGEAPPVPRTMLLRPLAPHPVQELFEQWPWRRGLG